MNITPRMYGEMSRQASPRSNVRVNTFAAFVTGGSICVIGQVISEFFVTAGLSRETSALWTSITLIVLSSLCTGFGWYQRLAKHAGAGTLVPITGFSNAVSSSAIEARSEGLVLGVGTKIFTIAGPVILYGMAAAFVYGLLYYIVSR